MVIGYICLKDFITSNCKISKDQVDKNDDKLFDFAIIFNQVMINQKVNVMVER